jgi:hypothetical protein
MDDGKATGVDPAIYFVTITYTDTVGEKLTDSAEVTSTTFDPGPYHNVEEETEENLDNKLAILIAYPESQYYASFDSRLLLRNQFQ